MKPRDRKLEILRQLSLESEPVSLSELVKKLHDSYTDRTVRRWVNILSISIPAVFLAWDLLQMNYRNG